MITLSREGPLARLILDRPEARNALPISGWHRLAGVAAGLDSDVRLVLVEGAEGAFCAGADLKEFGVIREDAEGPKRFREAMRVGIEAIAALPMPTVALVDGACYGAGLGLALACDMRVAGSDARFATTPAKIGISYPQEDIFRLTSLVGAGQAARMLLGAEVLDGQEALRIGLADFGPDTDRDALAERLLANVPESQATLKTGIGLAIAGQRSDSAQDAAFDALMHSDELARRLEARRV